MILTASVLTNCGTHVWYLLVFVLISVVGVFTNNWKDRYCNWN